MTRRPSATPRPTATEGIPDTLADLATPIDELRPYERNPRRGNIETIAESLRHHGQYRPVVARRGTGQVLAGNHTLAAARSLGWTHVAATWVDCDDEQAARIVLVDNRSNDVAGYDDTELLDLLRSLPDDTSGVAFRRAFAAAGWDLKQVLVWVKNTMVLGRQDHQWQHEPILYGWKPGAAHAWYGGRALTTLLADDHPNIDELGKRDLARMLRDIYRQSSTVIRANKPARSAWHPTMKPVGMLEDLLTRSTRLGDLVLDTCAGSGSTLIAAHGTRRVAAVVEADPVYADVICRRYQEHTGTTPVLEATGEPHDFTDAEGAA